MPRLKRIGIRHRGEWSQQQRQHLLTGRSFFDDTFADDDQMRQAWSEIGEELTAEWIAERPGTRPWGWWKFVAKEPRRCLSGPHPFTNGARTRFLGDKAKLTRFGLPRMLVCPTSAPGCPDDFACRFESERDFLERLGLLTQAERNLLGA